jgi:hypothetical protein
MLRGQIIISELSISDETARLSARLFTIEDYIENLLRLYC